VAPSETRRSRARHGDLRKSLWKTIKKFAQAAKEIKEGEIFLTRTKKPSGLQQKRG
jgi:hypothetical protein